MGFLRKHLLSLVFSVFSVLLYASFAYDLVREDFVKLITLYGALFFFYIKLIQTNPNRFQFLFVLSVLFRLVFLLAEPNLSQDYYRFIWDGRMLAEGLNPFTSLPQTFAETGAFPIYQGRELYEGMGVLNGSHYTVYPPLNQFVFWLAAWCSPKSIWGAVVVMRLCLVLFDLGIIWVGAYLLKKWQMPATKIFWYALNPFVVIELTGNLHFEGMMVFFLLCALVFAHQKNWLGSAVFLALSALTKMITLLFLPIFIKYWGWKKALLFYGVSLFVFFGFYLPFYTEGFIGFHLKSLRLYFSNFEFNASLFNIVKWIGYEVKGYNIIRSVGKYSPYVVILMVLLIAFFRKNQRFDTLVKSLILSITLYYFLATTVHPWYLALPLLLSVFTRFTYILVWTLVVMLSYFTYTQPDFIENPFVLLVEYAIVYFLFFKEWRKPHSASLTDASKIL